VNLPAGNAASIISSPVDNQDGTYTVTFTVKPDTFVGSVNIQVTLNGQLVELVTINVVGGNRNMDPARATAHGKCTTSASHRSVPCSGLVPCSDSVPQLWAYDY
jgi:hypothetical protein